MCDNSKKLEEVQTIYSKLSLLEDLKEEYRINNMSISDIEAEVDTLRQKLREILNRQN